MRRGAVTRRGRGNREEIRDLFQQYQKAPSLELRNKLVMVNLGLVEDVLWRSFRYHARHFDDLRGIGCIGLIKAVERYDPARGVSFSAYASSLIEGEIRRHFRDNERRIKLQRTLYALYPAIIRANDSLVAQLGRQPTTAEVAAKIGISEDEVERAVAAQTAQNTVSLDEIIVDDGGVERTRYEMVAGQDGSEAEQRVENRIMVESALTILTSRERQVIGYIILDQLSQAETARRLGISQAHAGRIYKRAIERMRSMFDNQTASSPKSPSPGVAIWRNGHLDDSIVVAAAKDELGSVVPLDIRLGIEVHLEHCSFCRDRARRAKAAG